MMSRNLFFNVFFQKVGEIVSGVALRKYKNFRWKFNIGIKGGNVYWRYEKNVSTKRYFTIEKQ